MYLKNTKTDFSSFNRVFGESSNDSFMISECEDFNIIWKPMGTAESKLEKDALVKNTEQYKKYASHLLSKYKVKASKKGELG